MNECISFNNTQIILLCYYNVRITHSRNEDTSGTRFSGQKYCVLPKEKPQAQHAKKILSRHHSTDNNKSNFTYTCFGSWATSAVSLLTHFNSEVVFLLLSFLLGMAMFRVSLVNNKSGLTFFLFFPYFFLFSTLPTTFTTNNSNLFLHKVGKIGEKRKKIHKNCNNKQHSSGTNNNNSSNNNRLATQIPGTKTRQYCYCMCVLSQ